MEKEKMGEKIILSISLLVSNRKESVRKTMESLKPLLQELPCELIVVDTVGEENSDGSLAIAKEYADKVIFFPWCKDFAAARNAGLKEAAGEWFLYLDDDEWFEDVTPIINFFKSGTYVQYDRGWYLIRNYHNFAGTSYDDVYVDRMCKRTVATRFEGKIHERLLPEATSVMKFSCFAHHYGYVYENDEARMKHAQRNISLIKDYLKECPADFRMVGQLVQEYTGIGQFKEAQELCLSVIGENSADVGDIFVQYLLVMVFRLDVFGQEWDTAEKRYTEILEKYPLREVPRLVCLAEQMVVQEKRKQYAIVLNLVNEFLDLKKVINAKGAAIAEQEVFDFHNYLTENKEREVIEKGIYAITQTEQYELAKALLDKVCWTDETNKPYGPMCWLVEIYEKTGRADLFYPYANQIMKNNKMKTQFAILINNMQRELKPMENIKLSIGILVSNRVQYIRKMLDALKPLLEAVPSELVIIDTKGAETDGSIEIAREYTDKIYSYTWCDDFAAARNFCLNHTQGEWFMFQDDDEWFDDVQELIDFFKSGECEKYNSGFYKVKSYDEHGNFTMAVVGRLIRRKKETCFVGRIHETFNSAPGPHKYFDCYVHHMGYAFPSAEAKKTHQERNASILLKELEEQGYSPKNCAQMVQELLSIEGTVAEGVAFAEKAIQELQKQGVMADSCAQWILAAIVRGCAMINEYEELLVQTKKIRSKYQRSRVTELVISAEVVKNAFAHGDYKLVCENVDSYLEQWDWLHSHEQEAQAMMQLDFPSFYTDEYYYSMLHAGAKAANHQRDYQGAMTYWNRFPWSQNGFNTKKYWNDLQETKKGLTPKQAPLIQSEIKLTIGMLVSNHVQYIRKAMEALKPLLEAVPSELVVLDTKGAETDGSIDIVREYTDKIYPFTWCNDFSAARNACLAHAKGEWFLYQDDDEWFDDVQEFIDFFQSGECENYYSGYYYTKDYNASGGSSMAIAGRMIRRTENTHFVGKVHETFHEVYGPNKLFHCFTHHMGYVFSTPESRKQHQVRNVSILKEELQEKGYTPRICAQMAQELLYVDETAKEGLEFAKKSIAELKNQGMIEDSCSQWLLTATIRYYIKYGTYEQVKQQAEAIRREYVLSKMASLAVAAAVAKVAGEQGDLDCLLDNVNQYIVNWDWLQTHPDEALLQTQMDFPKYYTKAYYHDILKVGAIAENHRRNFEKAKAYWDRFPWDEAGFDGSSYYAELQVTFAGLKEARKQKQEQESADKEELKQLYSVLYEAEPVVRQYILEERTAESLELLTGMQEVIIALGNKLEAMLDETTEVIRELEQCCELIWQCANAKTKDAAVDLLDEAMTKLQDVKIVVGL